MSYNVSIQFQIPLVQGTIAAPEGGEEAERRPADEKTKKVRWGAMESREGANGEGATTSVCNCPMAVTDTAFATVFPYRRLSTTLFGRSART
jgi:hypothetical protein